MKKEAIKLIIIDSEEVFREGLVKLLNEQGKMEIVLHCSSGEEAIERIGKTKLDMVLMDSHTINDNALQTLKEMRVLSPEIKVVMLSRSDAGGNPLDYMKAGARALLSKTVTADDLIKSLELISSGRIIISPLFADKFMEELSFKKEEESKVIKSKPILSERELEIAKYIAQGATNKEIAEKLFIADNTVKVHVKNILNKLELKNRQQLAVYAVMKEWIKNNPEVNKSQEDSK